MLLVKQSFSDMGTFWSLPGGKVEEGELVSDAAQREVREETGYRVDIQRLLYVAHRTTPEKTIMQVIFEAELSDAESTPDKASSTEQIHEIAFVPFDELEKHGISKEFADRVRSGFPDAGSYHSDIKTLGL